MRVRMRFVATASLLAAALGCATERAPVDILPPPAGPGSVMRAAELARVRCLLVAPFENGSDAPLAAEAATRALLSGIDPARTRVFPVPELRALFRDTPLELPQGIPPSLALELAELVGADAALWGSVEGRWQDDTTPELLVTLRVSLVDARTLLFAETVRVGLVPGVSPEPAVRRAVLATARPMLARLGDPGRKRCFDAERSHTLRRFALAEETPAKASAAPAPAPPAPIVQAAAPQIPPPPSPPATAPAPQAPPAPRTPRQAEWSKKLADGGRVIVSDLVFNGRTASIQRDGGLADLAAVLALRPDLGIRIEGFVDTTSDRAGDQRLSSAMAQAAGKRLIQLGVQKQRLRWTGRGGASPVLPNFTARGRAANRRIEVVPVP